jgi:hypothetical protein|tara:strand:- start:1276 stop:1470 length:195 start_codon:yes stop_codon:yes gene_type:complete
MRAAVDLLSPRAGDAMRAAAWRLRKLSRGSLLASGRVSAMLSFAGRASHFESEAVVKGFMRSSA